MSRTRGHVIAKKKDVWVKRYLAYNANPDWMLKVLAINPSDSASFLGNCHTGISQFSEEGVPREYHDHAKIDQASHGNEEFGSLDDALNSCVFDNIYVWDGVSWSHHTLVNIVSPERLLEIRPPYKRRNVWRETRKANEARKASGEAQSE